MNIILKKIPFLEELTFMLQLVHNCGIVHPCLACKMQKVLCYEPLIYMKWLINNDDTQHS